MRRSESHILTTHAGALPRPDELLPLPAPAQPSPSDADNRGQHLRTAVAENQRYRFTTWRWGRPIVVILVIGAVLKAVLQLAVT